MRHVIIGVGAAGISAAGTIRQNDPAADIIMISKDEFVHSRCMLHRYLSHERDEKALSFVPEDYFETNRIYWIKGRSAEKIDTKQKEVLLDGGERIAYDKLLIATGAKSFLPPVGQMRRAKNVFGLRDLSDAQAIDRMSHNAKQILIVGSGLVGMDAAYAFLERGFQVSVVEMADRILPIQLDETAGKAYQQLFEKAGCRFILGRKASETVLDDDDMLKAVILDDGTRVECDLAVVAAGVRAAIECAADSTVQSERFINVNERLQTSDPDVFAAGDVAGLSGIWPNAQKQGQIAGWNMCGIQMNYVDTYAMKNTMNFYGLTTLSLGRGAVIEGDQFVICEDSRNYKRAIIRDGKLDSILLQGDISYSGIYQYLIKNQIVLGEKAERIFDVSFADYFDIGPDGQYCYKIF
ncbi:MAG: FAD-dependent oxidoreductase [Lachnospiraceae bacterium]|nr:FAD-dependent oxidoreductase [Lachnospiraceae bacterium]